MSDKEDLSWVHFHDLVVNLRLTIIQQLSKDFESFIYEFNTLKTNKNRIAFCVGNEAVNRSIEIVRHEIFKKLPKCGKSDEKSKELRLCGNEFFRKGSFAEAAEFYTRALMNANIPCESVPNYEDGAVNFEELGLCFGNRSAALLRLKNYSQAIADIDDALKYSGRNSTKKLLLRKIECLTNLKRLTEIKHIIDSNSDLLSDSRASIERRLESITEAEIITKSVSEKRILNKNSCMSDSTDSIEVRFTESKGRHIVATKDINVSEVLVIEKPYSWYLDGSLFLQQCQHCLKKLDLSGIPCMKCSEVLFCSYECRKLSKSYHDNECCYCLSALSSFGISYLVLRTLFTTKLKVVLEAVKLMEENSRQLKSYETNYDAVFSLGNHESDFEPEDQLHFTLAAILLLSIYENVSEEHLISDTRLLLGCGILQHIQQLNTNAISIFAQEISNTVWKSEVSVKESRLGIGFYPIISLFNHSCLPNTVVFYSGSQITIETSRKVNSGDELFFCYGPSVRNMSFKDRQKVLKSQYFFDCDCIGCLERAENRRRAFLCPKCKGALIISEDFTNECLDCKAVDLDVTYVMNKVEESRRLAEEGKQLLLSEDFDEAVIKLSLSNKMKEKCCYRLCDELKEVKNDLCTCVAMLQHFDVAFQYCKQVLSITTEIFGQKSVEVAQVMMKMVSLKLRAIDDLREESEENAKDEALNFLPFLDSTIENFQKLDSIGSRNKSSSVFTSEIEYLYKNRQILVSYI